MKLAVTIAITDKGVPEVIAGPSDNVDAQIVALRKLTDKAGKDGKKQYAEACIIHTTKGAIKSRKF